MIYFTSDTHFHHKNVISYSNRPYLTVEHMNSAMIHNWNIVVKPKDTVYHLGDFCLSNRPDDWKDIRKQLNGTIHLIKGNHDKKNTIKACRSLFESVSDIKEVKHDGYRLVLCHYPLESWNRMHYGVGHLHGHCHGTLKSEKQWRIDVGVDCHDYRPVSFDEVVELIGLQKLINIRSRGL